MMQTQRYGGHHTEREHVIKWFCIQPLKETWMLAAFVRSLWNVTTLSIKCQFEPFIYKAY